MQEVAVTVPWAADYSARWLSVVGNLQAKISEVGGLCSVHRHICRLGR